MSDFFIDGRSVSTEDKKWIEKASKRKTRTRCPHCNRMTKLENFSIAFRFHDENDFVGCHECIIEHFANHDMITPLHDKLIYEGDE